MGELPEGRGILSNLALLLCQYSKQKAFYHGKKAHHHIYESGYENSRFLANWVIQMYGECGLMDDARAVFDKIRCPNTHSWTILLAMYALNGHMDHVENVFCRMTERKVVSWNALLSIYG